MWNRKWDRYSFLYQPTSTPYQPPQISNSITKSIPSISDIPNDLLVKILSYLPVSSAIRSSLVSKRWHESVRSLCSGSSTDPSQPQKPWYFMFICEKSFVTGFAYDSSCRKWYMIDFPCLEKGSWYFSASNGLVCLMDAETGYRIFVCNPIRKDWRLLLPAPGNASPEYCALSISVESNLKSYNVAVVKCFQVNDEYYDWDLGIYLYQSVTDSWKSVHKEVLVGSRGGDECVICNGVLYYLISTIGVLGKVEPRHKLVWFDLTNPSCNSRMVDTAVKVPCALTCAHLMNINDKLFMVGGIGKADRPGVVKGIGIWELCSKEWKEIAKMPHRFFQGFGEFDELFASAGSGDLICIQSYGSPVVLTYDLGLNVWKWASKSPFNKRFPLQIYNGLCFEPRLETCV
ncbi:hypothetical protein LUZ60_012534 [Juncus effusus]|nr:hypothetical protein LUZ60_012534 [Juncus effusus]